MKVDITKRKRDAAYVLKIELTTNGQLLALRHALDERAERSPVCADIKAFFDEALRTCPDVPRDLLVD